jgi:hypothetical protein
MKPSCYRPETFVLLMMKPSSHRGETFMHTAGNFHAHCKPSCAVNLQTHREALVHVEVNLPMARRETLIHCRMKPSCTSTWNLHTFTRSDSCKMNLHAHRHETFTHIEVKPSCTSWNRLAHPIELKPFATSRRNHHWVKFSRFSLRSNSSWNLLAHRHETFMPIDVETSRWIIHTNWNRTTCCSSARAYFVHVAHDTVMQTHMSRFTFVAFGKASPLIKEQRGLTRIEASHTWYAATAEMLISNFTGGSQVMQSQWSPARVAEIRSGSPMFRPHR